jgi:hypothetical protein
MADLKESLIRGGIFVRAGYFLQDHWSHFLVIIGTLGLTFSSYLFFPYEIFDVWVCIRILTGILCICAFIFGEFFSARKTAGFTALQQQNVWLKQIILRLGEDALAIWRFKLGSVSKAFGFESTERVSLYKHENGIFIMLGRYSEDPILDRKGRGEYPENQGCIESAYRQGKAIERSLPDPSLDSESYYKLIENKWKIPIPVMEKCRMKSRSYAGFAVNDETRLNKVAVIMFESTKENAFDFEALENAIKGELGEDLMNLMRVLQPMEPSISLAKNMGL